jgi:hypothetical protein
MQLICTSAWAVNWLVADKKWIIASKANIHIYTGKEILI